MIRLEPTVRTRLSRENGSIWAFSLVMATMLWERNRCRDCMWIWLRKPAMRTVNSWAARLLTLMSFKCTRFIGRNQISIPHSLSPRNDLPAGTVRALLYWGSLLSWAKGPFSKNTLVCWIRITIFGIAATYSD